MTGVTSGDSPCGVLNADRKLASGEAARVRQGVSAATELDVLCKLADDRSVIVRAALALNPAAPSKANEALAGDPDHRVITLLARKLATLAPSLSAAVRRSCTVRPGTPSRHWSLMAEQPTHDVVTA